MNLRNRVHSSCQNNIIGGSMEQLSTLSYQEKEQLLHHLGRIYRKGRFQAAIACSGMVEDQEGDDQDMELTARIRLLLQQMDRRFALILLNDFFELKQGDWWKPHFSKSSYYRYKKAAVDLLLEEILQSSF